MVSKDAIVAYTDGGSRGNPGPAGFGVRVESADGSPIAEFHESLGVATNNVAEYRGLLAALAWALDHGYRRLHLRSDSQLLVRQMLGQYRVKNPGLQALHREARELVARFERVGFEYVPRDRNADADRLANRAMDEAAGQTTAGKRSNRRPTTDAQPTTDDAPPATTEARPTTDDAPPSTTDARPTTNDAPPATRGRRLPTTDHRPPTDQRPGQHRLPFQDDLPDNPPHSKK